MVNGRLGISRHTLDRQLINVHDGGSLRVEARWTYEALLMLGRRQALALEQEQRRPLTRLASSDTVCSHREYYLQYGQYRQQRHHVELPPLAP